MVQAAVPWLRDRGAAALALILPTGAGLAYLTALGAPAAFVALNALALAIGLAAILFGRIPSTALTRRLVAVGLVGLLAMPVLAGPSLDGVSRWLAIGGFTLHAGMLVIPLTVRLLASDPENAPWLFLAAVVLAFVQPDSGSALALTVAAVWIGIGDRNSRWIAMAALGAAASLGAGFAGNVPPQPFVERVITELWQSYPIAALALALSFAGAIALIAFCTPVNRLERAGVCGALCGFMLAAVLGNYPYPLIGFGAAPIIGLGLALMRVPDAGR